MKVSATVKGVAKRKRPPSKAEALKTLRAILTATDEAIALFRAWGREGGKKGGKARWKGLSQAQRSEIARKAAQARWRKNTVV